MTTLFLPYVFLILGIALLYWGGEVLVDNAVALARTMKMKPMVIGLTVVAFGTSCPELAATLTAATQGSPAIAVGNVFGSNVANIALILAISVMRIVTPDDLGKRDQERPISYILDVVQNDNWLCPRDASGMITSKPPMHPWIAAGVAILLGRVDRAAWLFPSLLTMLATTLILYEYGRRRLGLHAALLASMAFLLSHPGFKMVTFVRTHGHVTHGHDLNPERHVDAGNPKHGSAVAAGEFDVVLVIRHRKNVSATNFSAVNSGRFR